MSMTTRERWGGSLWPPELLDYFLTKLLSGSPFADALSRFPTDRGSVLFPITAPGAGSWISEGERIPKVQLNDSTDIVAVCKLASLHSVTNEAIRDTSFPIAQQIGKVLADADGPELDRAFLYGEGAKEPEGVIAKAAAVAEPATDLREGAIKAWAELLSVGASPSATRVFVNPLQLGSEWARTGADGHPINPNQAGSGGDLVIGPGVPITSVPTLAVTDVLAVDTSATYFVVREQLSFEMSEAGEAWEYDSQSIRVKLRSAVACPLPQKSLRKITIEAPEPERARETAKPREAAKH